MKMTGALLQAKGQLHLIQTHPQGFQSTGCAPSHSPPRDECRQGINSATAFSVPCNISIQSQEVLSGLERGLQRQPEG